MKDIELVEVQTKYADDIWEFRREILECDAEDEDQFAGCLSLDEVHLPKSGYIYVSVEKATQKKCFA